MSKEEQTGEHEEEQDNYKISKKVSVGELLELGKHLKITNKRKRYYCCDLKQRNDVSHTSSRNHPKMMFSFFFGFQAPKNLFSLKKF